MAPAVALALGGLPALAASPARSPQAPVRLDAGPAASPVWDVFDPLTLDGCGDPRVTWMRPPTDAHHGAFPDPLTGDDLLGGTLALDLSPGPWTVWVQLGTVAEAPALWTGVDEVGLDVQGAPGWRAPIPPGWEDWLASPDFSPASRPRFEPPQTAWDRQIAPRQPWHRVEVVVPDDGPLTLSAVGRPLQALVAFPADDAVVGEVELAEVDGIRRGWWGHLPRSPRPPAPTAVPGPLEAQVLPPATAPHPSTLLAPGPAAPAARRLPDSPWHRWVVIHGGDAPGTVEIVDAPDDVTVAVHELDWLDAAGHPDRALIPRPWVQGRAEGWQGGQGVPPVLSLRLTPHADAPPGPRRIRLRLQRADGQHTTIPLTLMVLDAPPLPPARPTGLYLQVPPEAMLRLGPDDPALHRLVAEHLGVLSRLGLTAVSLRYTRWGGPGDPDLPSVFHRAARTWARLGGRVLVWADPKIPWRQAVWRGPEPRVPEGLREATAARLAEAAASPVPTTAVHVYEEESWRALASRDRAAAVVADLDTLSPDDAPFLWLAAMPTRHDLAAASAFDVVTVTGPELADHAALARASGARVWGYNLAPGRTGALQAWAAGVDAHLQWHADPEATDPSWTVRPRPRWQHLVLRPDGLPHPTALALDLADGVALARLLDAVQDLPPCGPRRARRRLDEALHALAHRLLTPIPPTRDVGEGPRLDDASLEAIRHLAQDAWQRCAPQRP